MHSRSLLPAMLPTFGMLLLAAPTLHAQVTSIPLFETLSYQQNDPTLVTSTGANFDARIFETHLGDATNARLTYPGPGSGSAYTPASYSTPANPVLDDFGGFFVDQATMDAAFPTGTYTTDYTDAGSNPQSISVNYTQTAFAGAAPAFTAATYNAMQGLDATQDFTFAFLPDVPSNVSDTNLVFFTLTDATTGKTVFDQGFFPSTTTEFTVPANTLLPGTTYFTDLNFSDRITSKVNGIETDLGFDQRTGSRFTTAAAVPEAATSVSFGLLLVLGMSGLALVKRKKA